jgi:hypothetical protein
MAPAMLLVAFAVAAFVTPAFCLVLAMYFAITLAYSLLLRRQVIVDVLLLAGLYTLRVVAGGAATGIVPSFWLLAFSMFIFPQPGGSSSATRRCWVTGAAEPPDRGGRGYSTQDLPVLDVGRHVERDGWRCWCSRSTSTTPDTESLLSRPRNGCGWAAADALLGQPAVDEGAPRRDRRRPGGCSRCATGRA